MHAGLGLCFKYATKLGFLAHIDARKPVFGGLHSLIRAFVIRLLKSSAKFQISS